MTKDEALKLALEALEIEEAQTHYPSQWLLKAITAIKEALANDALEKKAENARELGLNYEPDWTPEEDEAFNEVEKHSNLGKQILREMGQPYHFEKREWVGLTDEEMETTHWSPDFRAGAKWAEAKLKEKNTWK